jgi:hypothetical protein
MEDIRWLDRLSDALVQARLRPCPVVVQPLGQGLGPDDDW